MPLADLLQRLEAVLGVHLFAEGEDVADQKIDLFATDLPAVEILTAITNLLNSEGPRGYRWEHSGRRPDYHYTVVRDIASRQWETRRAFEAEDRLPALLRTRLQALGHEPFRADPIRSRELPAMRKVLAGLSDAQVSQLAAERFLRLAARWEPAPSPLWKELSDQFLEQTRRRDPERTDESVRGMDPHEFVSQTRAEIRLAGDPTGYIVRMAVSTPAGGVGMADVCRLSDPASVRESQSPMRLERLPADRREPVFSLPPRRSWFMGDVLADIAARANLNLIADDYTRSWSELARFKTPQPASAWLNAIEEEYGYVVVRDGAFLRLRNRRWWLDQRREVPQRLLSRWTRLVGGTLADRLQAGVEIARWAPFCAGFLPTSYRLGALGESPEIKELSAECTDPNVQDMYPDFVELITSIQTELLIYALLPPGQQQAVRDQGLTLSWQEMPSAARALFARRVCDAIEPGIRMETVRRSSLFIQFNDDQILIRWLIAGLPPAKTKREEKMKRLIFHFVPAKPVRAHSLVGQLAPELQVEDPTGKSLSNRPHGLVLLYFAPAWPRPVVMRKDEFTDLLALQGMLDADTSGRRLLVLGTNTTAAELRTWWKERRLTLPPLAVAPASARLYGVRNQPVAVIIDVSGRVAWVKEAYAPGDEAEWRRELERASG
jgi:hypothetical protein